jgi:membrane-associated PAP2 superfamily phosphatase
VVLASVFPLDDPQVHRAALFVHLMSMAVGFGAVVMIDVYGLQWLFGLRTLAELVELAVSAHPVIAIGLGGLLSSGIALRPELGTPMARVKMVLVLVVMINGVVAQRVLHRMRQTLPPETRGASIPWDGFQRALAVALISQATWWGSIAIGFITNANRAP